VDGDFAAARVSAGLIELNRIGSVMASIAAGLTRLLMMARN
jgi:hypothetical protein